MGADDDADEFYLLLSSLQELSFRELSIDAFYHVLIHLATQLQRTRLLEIDQLEARIAYGSHIC
jgi:hypothetical protein